MSEAPRATRLLQELSAGDEEARNELYALVYAELHRIAEGYMRKERGDHTLQPTALVHEAFVRLVGNDGTAWKDGAHFLGTAARAMRNLLVDHARRKKAAQRDGSRSSYPLDQIAEEIERQSHGTLALDAALDGLEGVDPELARIVELRFFGGLTHEDIARAMEVSVPTIERRWRVARTWLRGELERELFA